MSSFRPIFINSTVNISPSSNPFFHNETDHLIKAKGLNDLGVALLASLLVLMVITGLTFWACAYLCDKQSLYVSFDESVSPTSPLLGPINQDTQHDISMKSVMHINSTNSNVMSVEEDTDTLFILRGNKVDAPVQNSIINLVHQSTIDKLPEEGTALKSAILNGQVDLVYSLLQSGKKLDESELLEAAVNPLKSQQFSEELIFSFSSRNPLGILELLTADLICRAQSGKKMKDTEGSLAVLLNPSVVTFQNNIFYTIPTPFPSVNIVISRGSIKISITTSSDAIVIGAVVLFAIHGITSVTGRFFQGISFTTVRQQVTGSAPTAPPPSTGRHVMISYAWLPSQHKRRIVQLTSRLKSLGVNIWRDEEGSNTLGPVCDFGNLYEALARAIETSIQIIIFVSKAYQESYNCQAELSYIIKKAQKSSIKLIFVKLEARHEPSGLLGFALGSSFYHELYDDNSIDSVAEIIARKIQSVV